MSRPMGDVEESTSRASAGPRRHRFSGLSDFNLLRKLEEMMWQAGMYMRVSEMVLIIVLAVRRGFLFGGNLFFHEPSGSRCRWRRDRRAAAALHPVPQASGV